MNEGWAEEEDGVRRTGPTASWPSEEDGSEDAARDSRASVMATGDWRRALNEAG